LDLGLHWIRRRQRALTRAVLGLFCAAWLQAAVVPCVMASVPADTVSEHAGHAHSGEGDDGSAGAEAPCPYCPPGAHDAHGGDGDSHGACAYPHDPRIDARTALALLAALPVTYVLPSHLSVPASRNVDREAPPVVRRVSLPVSYCRFIE
jgi:hypothetical protein